MSLDVDGAFFGGRHGAVFVHDGDRVAFNAYAAAFRLGAAAHAAV